VAIAPLATGALASSVGAPVTLSGTSPFASCTTPGNDTFYPNAATQPLIAVNPATAGTDHANLIAAWEQDKWEQINSRGLVAAYSLDGGATWARSDLPFGQCANPSSAYDRVSSAWVSIGPDGTAYVTAGGTKPDGNAIWAATSGDGGKTWGNVSTISENTAASKLYAFHPVVTADPSKSGVAYLSWTRNLNTANGPQTIWFSKTTDAGTTWSKPSVMVQEPNWSSALGAQLLVDAHSGTLYEPYAFYKAKTVKQRVCKTVPASGKKGKKGTKPKQVCTTKSVVPPNPEFTNSLDIVKSADGGQTWSAPTTIRQAVNVTGPPPPGNVVVANAALPVGAVDQSSGKVYLAVSDASLSGGKVPEITMISSSDGGATWSSPVRVSSAAGVWAFLPSVAVNAAGTVGVTYYDLRNATGGKPGLTADYWFTSSTDGGATFGNEQHVAGPYDLGSAPVIADQGGILYVYIGEYQGLAAVGARFQAAFVATTGVQNNSTNVMTESVTP
jgi:hypothetical protein